MGSRKMILNEASLFKLIDKRMMLLKLVGVALSIFSGILMVAMVMFSDRDSEISRYTLVCQAANKMANLGFVHAEVIRSFPLDIWIQSGSGDDNKLVILKAEVNNERKYYALADTVNDIPVCLGELSKEYSPRILSLPIEYEDRLLIVGEVLETQGSPPPIFVQMDYSIQVGGQIIHIQKMASVYGREFLFSDISGSLGQKMIEIEGLCVATDSNGSGLYMYNQDDCKFTHDSNIANGLNPVIIRDRYFIYE